MFCPVPGSQVVSFAIWTALLSSTAASTINIAQSIDEGSGTWQENAIDGLTIVSNLLAGSARSRGCRRRSGPGRWAEGAVIRMAEEAPAAKFTSRSAAALGIRRGGNGRRGGRGTGRRHRVARGCCRQGVRWLLPPVANNAAQGILIGEEYFRNTTIS